MTTIPTPAALPELPDDAVHKALDALAPEVILNRYGYKKGYRVRDVMALDDHEAEAVMSAALQAVTTQPAKADGDVIGAASALLLVCESTLDPARVPEMKWLRDALAATPTPDQPAVAALGELHQLWLAQADQAEMGALEADSIGLTSTANLGDMRAKTLRECAAALTAQPPAAPKGEGEGRHIGFIHEVVWPEGASYSYHRNTPTTMAEVEKRDGIPVHHISERVWPICDPAATPASEPAPEAVNVTDVAIGRGNWGQPDGSTIIGWRVSAETVRDMGMSSMVLPTEIGEDLERLRAIATWWETSALDRRNKLEAALKAVLPNDRDQRIALWDAILPLVYTIATPDAAQVPGDGAVSGTLESLAAQTLAESLEGRVCGYTPGQSKVQIRLDAGAIPEWLEIGESVTVASAPQQKEG